ncbi:Conjugated polyketone reductase C1 [Rhodotorula toruloides ATCC 204091]|uniref:Conjugated polyketone reductase C1 n=1 Tax=Rhodotorula toruloides TaxID=5286 RepID=A0A0K3CBX4_RHOTO|nr:Conjugated polyketone reductase C1 [Rhodotorula toruloides ATCC 204091]PRQ76131.1 conjugated polyketone reductase C1 [Rhodotorula toruloides]
MAVPTLPLSDGTQIPSLAWGNGTGDAKKTATESGRLAIKVGIRHIDTAQGYENEKETGESIAIAEKDNGIKAGEIYLTTKLSTEKGDPTNPGISLEELRHSVRGSLQRLGRQPNLVLIHNPFVPPKGKLVEFWKILEEMKDKGELTASLGVSNFRPQDFEELLPHCKYPPVVNQLEYHPYVLTHLQPVLDIMEKHNIRVESYGGLSPLLRHPTGGPIKPLLEKVAARLSKESGKDVDAAMALILWQRSKGVVVVTASGNAERIEKLSLTQELPDLTKEDVDEIESVGRKIHYRAYDEHMCVDFPAPDLPKDA